MIPGLGKAQASGSHGLVLGAEPCCQTAIMAGQWHSRLAALLPGRPLARGPLASVGSGLGPRSVLGAGVGSWDPPSAAPIGPWLSHAPVALGRAQAIRWPRRFFFCPGQAEAALGLAALGRPERSGTSPRTVLPGALLLPERTGTSPRSVRLGASPWLWLWAVLSGWPGLSGGLCVPGVGVSAGGGGGPWWLWGAVPLSGGVWLSGSPWGGFPAVRGGGCPVVRGGGGGCLAVLGGVLGLSAWPVAFGSCRCPLGGGGVVWLCVPPAAWVLRLGGSLRAFGRAGQHSWIDGRDGTWNGTQREGKGRDGKGMQWTRQTAPNKVPLLAKQWQCCWEGWLRALRKPLGIHGTIAYCPRGMPFG